MTISDNLKKLMFQYGNMTVSDLAKATNLPQPTLYQLFVGATEHPRKKTLQTLANYFALSINQLIGAEPLPEGLPKKLKEQLSIHTTPILTWDDLYNWPDKINFEEKEEIILETHSSDKTFALEMKGSSMEPLFPNSCLLIFDSKKPTKDRDCVIIYIQKTNQFSFKKILMDGNSIYVKSINPELNDLTTIQVTDNDKIIATLLEARIKF